MKYGYLPKLMWRVFAPNFKKQLNTISSENTKKVMNTAHKKYKEILADIQEFDKDDRFILNILSASMLAAVYLSLDNKPDVGALTDYYAKSMNNLIMRIHLRKSNQFTANYQDTLREDAKKSKKRINPYSWVYDFREGDDINSFTATFHTCGICYLLNSLGIPEIAPALCRYDYTMAEQTGTEFTRKYTIASGGKYCDCHYKNRRIKND